MQAYHYTHGDRPLEGYTIQRGVGRGGFGEVYYAVSDAGREVALKVLTGHEQIELRGVAQCMNLKSPYLVTVFDVRQNEEGRNFVIMEYVNGPSMRELLDEAPAGLGVQKAAFFLRELGKGLTYLHDRGIVHRDLKPGNIFYEDGYVKIGDYGLSKAISESCHSGQTITVGTVHYMAPEIGQGRYDKSIDIYALGCVLYEMLTGHVPFFGASHGEVLMKHLVDPPDCSGVEEPFCTVVRKALAKAPEERYQSVQEMVEAVFGTDHIRESVSCFAPESLSLVAERVARRVPAGGGSSGQLPGMLGGGAVGLGGDSSAIGAPVAGDRLQAAGQRVQARLELAGERVRVAGQRVQTRLGDAAERLAGADRFAGPPPLPEIARRDVLTYGQRCFLGLLIAVVMGVASGVLQDGGRRAGANIPCVIVAIVLGLLGLGVAWKYWQGGPETLGIRRLVIGLTLTVCVLVGGLIGGVDGPAIQAEGLTALAAPLLLCNWNTLLDRRRPRRLSLWPAVWMGIVGVTAIEFFADGRGSLLGMAIVAGLVLASQASMVWIPGRSTGVEYGVDLEPATIAVPPQRPAPAAAAYQPTPAPPPSGEPVRVSVAPPPLPGTTLAGPVSPYLRLPALLLNAVGVFGICGLHRFYVGKWLSGFIWLCTFGLMGIGQIYDLIMIITGGFTDDDERPLVAWQQLNEPGVRLAAARVGAHIAATNRTGRVIRVRRTSIPLAILGYAVLLPGLILGLACVVHIYDVVAGVADINRDMTRSFGYPDWPHLLERITVTVTLAVMGAATLLLATARARAGVAHVARGIVGIAGLAIAGTAFYDGLGQINWTVFWAAIEKTPGPALEMLFKSFDGETLIVGLVLSTAAMIVLLWPEKRQALNGSDTAGLEVQA